jgi:hypothetical protein
MTEKLFKCPRPGCGSTIPESGKDEHMRGHRDRAAFENRVNQFLTRFEGNWLPEQFNRVDAALKAIHDDLESIDEDIKAHETRLVAIEDRPTADPVATPDGVQIDTWDDDTTDDEPVEPASTTDAPEEWTEGTPTGVDHPDAAPYATALQPAQVDDLQARIAAQTAGIHL